MTRSGAATNLMHFTRAAILRPIVEFFDGLGSPTCRYLVESHLSPSLLEDATALVPVRLLHAFVTKASRAEGVEHPGLCIGESMTLRDLGPYGDHLLHTRNVFDYLDTGCRFIACVSTNERFWLEFDGAEVRFCADVDGVEQPLEAYLLVLDVTINTVRAAVEESWIPPEITLPVNELPALQGLHPAFSNVRAEPGRRGASFTLPRSFLTRPMRPPDRPGESLSRLAPVRFTTFEASMRQLAEVLVLAGHADVATAADATGLSPRTLQRRLAEHGLSFSRLVLEARISLSEQWLRERDRSINDVAMALGYTDSANFTRAFRRVNGLSPVAYRSDLMAPAPGA